jgi:hypothetical protein
MDEQPHIDAVLARLSDLIAARPNLCVFNPPATEAEIADAESRIGTSLPASFKAFLRLFNGGFISMIGATDEEYWDHGSAEWNSNVIFGIERLLREFAEMRYNQVEDFGEPEPWHYIPFLHTDGQELLVFGPALDSKGERPVMDAFHESRPDSWGSVYPSFTQMLTEYIARDGKIKTIGA